MLWVQPKNFIYIALTVISLAISSQSHEFDDDFYQVDDSPTAQNQPSMAPSLNLSEQPTNASFPTVSPTIPKSSKISDESKNSCHVSDSGFYGDEISSNLRAEYIRYLYQMEYKRNSNTEEILNDLELAISETILKETSLFSECTIHHDRLLFSTHAARNLEQSIVGLSSNPTDIITSNLCPSETVFNDSSCSVIEGILTVFYKEEHRLRRITSTSEISTVIEEGMGNGSLSLSNNNIRHLEYLPPSSLSDEIDESNAQQGQEDDGDSQFNSRRLSIVLYSACGSILLVGLITFKWGQMHHRRKCMNDEDNDSMVSSAIAVNKITMMDDDSSNFMSSVQMSDSSLLARWKQSAS